MTHNGLVLTAGGARAAYQAGVLRGIAEVIGPRADGTHPFDVIAGTSAGAINGTLLASRDRPFRETVEELCELWSTVTPGKVMNTSIWSIGSIALRLAADFALGFGRSNHLISTQPLRHLLGGAVDFSAIRANISRGLVHGCALTVTSYKTGTAISFFDGHPSIQGWARSSRLGQRSTLTLDHLHASTAIPVIFKPVKIGGIHYGDGGLRLSTPLSPAIHMGAERLLAIGVRYHRPIETTMELNANPYLAMKGVTFADIAGVILNATFLDALDSDAERMSRINATLSLLTDEQKQANPVQLRPIPLLVISPSRDLGTLAAERFESFPWALRMALRGIGASRKKGWDLVSYLAFDGSYTRALVNLGRSDAISRGDEIKRFLE